MRVLVLSDTHGQLSYINQLADKHKANAVIHCGDFGFLTHRRTEKMSSRELSLIIKHCPHLSMDIKKMAWDYSEKEKVVIINENQALGEFDEYRKGLKKFNVPVYTVWGNHEDSNVIRELLLDPIENLILLSSTPIQLLDSEISLFGVGGNMSLKRFFRKPLSNNISPFMTFQEWTEIRQNIKEHKLESKKTWMVTHVSPGKEPLLELFSMQLRPHMWFSGHMGAPLTQHYSLFTYLDDPDFGNRLDTHLNLTTRNFNKWKTEVLNWFELKEYVDNNAEYENRDIFVNSERINRIVKFSKDSDEYKRITSNLHAYIKALQSNNTFVSSYPDESTFQMIVNNDSLFDNPVDTNKRSKSVNNYYGRKSAKYVKGTWFWNMPDVYTGGYVVIETDVQKEDSQSEARYEITTHGFLR